MSARRAGLPLLLLLLVTGGLFAMHTIGHQGMPGMGTAHGSHAATITPGNPEVALPASNDESVAAGPSGPLHRGGAIVAGSQPGMTPTTDGGEMPGQMAALCVAVLGALMVWGLTRLRLLRADLGNAGESTTAARGAGGVRGPPGRALGLLIADLSVLRH